MSVGFSKYVGAGNDFIIIDNRGASYPSEDKVFTRTICCRRLGVGADGVLLLEHSTSADYRIRIFNADGSEAEMCGNGMRCIVQYLHDRNMGGPSYKLETQGRLITGQTVDEGVTIEMGDPSNVKWDLMIEGVRCDYLDTGVPHVVFFVEDLEEIDLLQQGRFLRHHSHFQPRGTNVDFIQMGSDGVLQVRTYERGVEAETLACGTGATASALAAARQLNLSSPVAVKVASGDLLTIDFHREDHLFTKITLTGPAYSVYNGTLCLQPDSRTMAHSSECP